MIHKNSKKTTNNRDQTENKKIGAILKTEDKVENNKIEIIINY